MEPVVRVRIESVDLPIEGEAEKRTKEIDVYVDMIDNT
jgi:hypothetical protein